MLPCCKMWEIIQKGKDSITVSRFDVIVLMFL